MFPFTTNASIKTGDGMALAYRAGAPLKDMEFVQYPSDRPAVHWHPHYRGGACRGGYLLNKDGYRYLQDYQLGTAAQAGSALDGARPRDRLSQAFMKELEKVASRLLTATSCTLIFVIWAERSSTRRSRSCASCARNAQNLDPGERPDPGRPVVHYMMGGVHTDINGATPLSGLYAAEVACVSINGANRLGSNSTSGAARLRRARGQAAAEYASREARSVRTCLRRCRTSDSGSSATCSGRPAGGTTRGHSRSDAEDTRGKRGYLSRWCRLAWAVGRLRELQDRMATWPSRITADVQHGARGRARARLHA